MSDPIKVLTGYGPNSKHGNPACRLFCLRRGHRRTATTIYKSDHACKPCKQEDSIRFTSSSHDPLHMVTVARPLGRGAANVCALICKRRHRRTVSHGCQECRRISSRNYLINNPEAYARHQANGKEKSRQARAANPWWGRARQHHTTTDYLENMWIAQEKRCANKACARPISPTSRGIDMASVDHDHSCCPRHSCGRCIRGLLCRSCNQTLFETNKLIGLVEYLRKPNQLPLAI